MKIFLSLLVFVSSCGTFVKDQAIAGGIEIEILENGPAYITDENLEVAMMSYQMYFSGSSCDDIQDFLIDTALDHSLSLYCPTDWPLPNGPWDLTFDF